LIAVAPPDYSYHYFRAIALVGTGDLAAFQAECERSMERFAQAANQPPLIYVCMWAPIPWTVKDRLLESARRFGPQLAAYAEYRAGNFQQALTLLEQTPANQGQPWDHLFKAMAHHRLGQSEKAQAALAEADKAIAASKPQRESNWALRLAVPILRREAEAVLAEPQAPGPE
jgi:hypothetical protein